MDATELAAGLLEPVPANRTFGIKVAKATDAVGEVYLHTPEAAHNVIGSLHASGLIALLDAAGLAALIGAAGPNLAKVLLPLGTAAHLNFYAPARGRLTAVCELSPEARTTLTELESALRMDTTATITDDRGIRVCDGTFTWHVRRTDR